MLAVSRDLHLTEEETAQVRPLPRTLRSALHGLQVPLKLLRSQPHATLPAAPRTPEATLPLVPPSSEAREARAARLARLAAMQVRRAAAVRMERMKPLRLWQRAERSSWRLRRRERRVAVEAELTSTEVPTREERKPEEQQMHDAAAGEAKASAQSVRADRKAEEVKR